ncbi:LacI family transcriptional regulator [Haloferula helveola]|uniref:LacI family transcriptional regulator n=2 Tax=Haloferula helveola TaxID=490095 RepID=A0ABM7RGQ6_9BACT|nr:LacI family transcriptional regulator [Haloferula helveola]
MPGRDKLAEELGVNRKTVEAALVKLEAQGVLESQGAGRRRLIRKSGRADARRMLTIGLLFHDADDPAQGFVIDARHELTEKGYAVVEAPLNLKRLNMDRKRVARMIGRIEADAWIVLGGSLEVLEWFVGRGKPVFALFGRRRGLEIPGVGPDKPPAYAAATRELIRLGHRRIVLMCGPERRIPEPGASERAFLAELASHGIALSRFHLPDWDGSIEGFHHRLQSLFRVTPPTAMILDEVRLFAAVQAFLASRGLRVPEDVSLVCTDHDPWFEWCRPTIAHIRWDTRPVVRRIVNWAGNLSRGRSDVRQVEVPAEFAPGGTIGRAPK